MKNHLILFISALRDAKKMLSKKFTKKFIGILINHRLIFWETGQLKTLVFCMVFISLPIFAQEQGWSFVQSVGGIRIEAPVKVAGVWTLPLTTNVSGLETVTNSPTVLNSGLVCKATHAVVEGFNIYISIVTDYAGEGKSAVCSSAKLGALLPGEYTIFYRLTNENPVYLGKVAVGV